MKQYLLLVVELRNMTRRPRSSFVFVRPIPSNKSMRWEWKFQIEKNNERNKSHHPNKAWFDGSHNNVFIEVLTWILYYPMLVIYGKRSQVGKKDAACMSGQVWFISFINFSSLQSLKSVIHEKLVTSRECNSVSFIPPLARGKNRNDTYFTFVTEASNVLDKFYEWSWCLHGWMYIYIL